MLKSKTGLREAGKGYIPQCEGDNGTFSPVQCSQDQESCWCVFDNGEEAPGTRVSGGRPACASEFLPEAHCFWTNPALELHLDPNFFPYLVVVNLLCSDLYRDFCSSSMLCVIADFRPVWAWCPVFSKCFVREKGERVWTFDFLLFIKLVKLKQFSYKTELESKSECLAANLNLFQSELALGLKAIQLTKIKFEKCMLLPFLLLACDQSCEKDVPKHYIFTEYFLHDQSCEALEFTHGFQWEVQMGDIWINLICNGPHTSPHHWSEEKQIKLSTRLCSKVQWLVETRDVKPSTSACRTLLFP